MTSVPLPEAISGPQPFAVEFELEVPAQLFVAQDQWRSLQIMSRLQSPSEQLNSTLIGTGQQHVAADALRELALSVAHRMKVHGDELARECFLANCLLSRAPSQHQLERMLARFQSVESDVAQARSRLDACTALEPQIESERALVAEFVSNQLLEFHFKARRAIDEHLRQEGGPHTLALAETAATFERAVHEPLQREIAYRIEHGFLTPTHDDPELLELYLERSSQLKKHFHELLFLSTETSLTDTRLRNYGTIFGAMAASVFGFILNKSGFLGQSASLGLVVAALAGAVVYALQDKIKDLGKTQLPSKLGKRYAQRVSRVVVPARGSRSGSKLVGTLEESLTTKLHSRPDPLNPQLGACRNVNVVRYTSRGIAQAVPELRARGIVSIKQIFRYDLSWLFTRLDNARKQVPVLASDGLRIAEAPRRYRMPVRVKLAVGDKSYDRSAVAVMHKGGLERLEFDGDETPQSVRRASLARINAA